MTCVLSDAEFRRTILLYHITLVFSFVLFFFEPLFYPSTLLCLNKKETFEFRVEIFRRNFVLFTSDLFFNLRCRFSLKNGCRIKCKLKTDDPWFK